MDFCLVLIPSCEPLVPCTHNRMNQSSMEAQTQMNDIHGVKLVCMSTQTLTHAHQPAFSSLLHSLKHEVVKLTVQLRLWYIKTPLAPLIYCRVVQLSQSGHRLICSITVEDKQLKISLLFLSKHKKHIRHGPLIPFNLNDNSQERVCIAADG